MKLNKQTPVPILFIPNLVRFSQLENIPIQPILDELGIKTDLLHIETLTIPYTVLCELISKMLEQSGDPLLGLRFGESFVFEYLPEMGTFISTSETPRVALEALSWVSVLMAPFLALEITEKGGLAYLHCDLPNETPEPVMRFFVESVFSTILFLGNAFIRDAYVIEKVVLGYKLQGPLLSYQQLFSCTIEAGAQANMLLVPSSVLDLSMNPPMPELHKQAEDLMEERLSRVQKRGDFIDQVRTLLMEHDRPVGIGHIAKLLDVTTRTLQRRLKEKNTSFSALQDNAKFHYAKKLLVETHESMDVISQLLGFSDRRSFSRAFSRWSDEAPSDYRKRLLGVSRVRKNTLR
ncbi:hypothetical protein A9Q99_24770 [Gammaproteobacteria bacterium 45_16_T64]|nr:hypothetical protein A9Q99_24770 [Gammaproteobacteria bacterium 45_16_T64]